MTIRGRDAPGLGLTRSPQRYDAAEATSAAESAYSAIANGDRESVPLRTPCTSASTHTA